ncbi:MAG: glutamine amidotransferase [Polyangiaceae bacterium]
MTKDAPRRIMVLRAGDPVSSVVAKRGQFSDLIAQTVGDAWPHEWASVDVRGAAPMPDLDASSAFVITGSSSSVTERAPWMLRTEEWIREAYAREKKVLGICFGHQLIGQALGGLVAKNPRGREIGKVKVTRLEKDPIFEDAEESFFVFATHVDSVITLPKDARLLATTDLEPNAAFAMGPFMRAVQYHPEIDADVMRSYIDERREVIRSENLDPEDIARKIDFAPHNSAALRGFVRQIVLYR